jgi:alpha,alpha-trehalose-phosphate synthase [UDP-forming]/trehalose-phosphatase
VESDISCRIVDWQGLARNAGLVVLTDLDGTLIPFAATPDAAVLDDDLARTLRALIENGLRVVAVTGRPRASVDPLRARVPGAWWIAEHGGWSHDGQQWQCSAAEGDELGGLVARLEGAVRSFAGARLERKTASVAVHWRGVADLEHPALVDAVDAVIEEWLESFSQYERLPGVAMVEVGPRDRHKGTAVPWVRNRVPEARIVALGDDITDERMFAALGAGDVAICVGPPTRPSRAPLFVETIGDARRLLRWLIEARMTTGVLQHPPVHVRPVVHAGQQGRTGLLVVSNRMPATDEPGRTRSVGGLVAALEPALREREGTWLGWSGQECDGSVELTFSGDARPMRAAFDLTRRWRTLFYGGFCNRSLWPLLHGFPGRVRYADDEWAAYVEANHAYGQFAADLVDPEGVVWVHDYHLLLTASALRHRGHRGPIGLFLHVPFPAPDVFETMPWAHEMLQSMMAFDLVGFHTGHWALNFLASARTIGGLAVQQDVLRHKDGTTRVAVFPLGVDHERFRHDRAADQYPDVDALRARLGERKLLLGVDRLDYSKGIPERLEAFERLLELHPRWRSHVSFVQISVPSREDVPEYGALRTRVEQIVGRINGRFGEADWIPVQYLYRSYDHDVLAQIYRAADIAVVTPLRDGMNLVAKEFVAAQDPDRPGVLVLSRFAGAAEELKAAVLTNPFHRDGLAADLDRALSMADDERRAQHALLRASVLSSTPARWAAEFLATLERVSATARGRSRAAR